jgi:hypothetical protein
MMGEATVRNGAFRIDLGEFEGGVLVEVVGGSYTEEADGTPVSLGDFPDMPMRSVAAGVRVSTETAINVTPYTTVAAAIVRNSGNRCTDVNMLIGDALMRTARFFRGDMNDGPAVNLLETTPADFTTTVSDPCSDEALLGSWNAGLSELGLLYGVTAIEMMGAMLDDMGDGIFDGYAADGSEIHVGGTPIGPDLATVQLAEAIESFLASDANRSRIELSDLDPGGTAACLGDDIDALHAMGANAKLVGPAAVVFPAGQDDESLRVGDSFELTLGFVDLFGAAQGTVTLPLDPDVLQADCDSFVPGDAIEPSRFGATCDAGSGLVTVSIAAGPPIAGGCGDLFTATIHSVGSAEPLEIAVGDIDLRTQANMPIEVQNMASTERTIARNEPPTAVISGPNPPHVLALGEFVLDATGSSDPDGDDLTFEWQDLSGGLLTIEDPTNPSTSITAGRVFVNSSAAVRLIVDDGRPEDSMAVTDFMLTVVPKNDPPIGVISVTPDTQVNEGTAVTLDAAGSIDPNGNTLSFSWVQTAGMPVEGLTGVDTPTVSFTTSALVDDDTVKFQLTILDDHLITPLTAIEQVTIGVQNFNDAPTAVIAAITGAPELTEVTLDGSGSLDPNPGDRALLRFQWTQTDGTPVELDGANEEIATFTAPEAPDFLTFELKVTDPGDLTHTAEVTIGVTAGLPLASAGDDVSVAEGKKDVKLDGSGSLDPDGGALTYLWQQKEGGPRVALAGADTTMPTFDAPSLAATDPEAVELTFELEVTDADGFSASDQVVVTVLRENDAPTAVIVPVGTVQPGDPVNLDGSASFDPNPGETAALTFAWRRVSGPEVVLEGADTANASFTAPDELGVVVLELKVTDPSAISDTAQESVTVSVPPVAKVTLGVDGGEDIEVTTFTVSFEPGDYEPIAVDPDDPTLGFKVEDAGANGAPVATQPAPGRMQVTHISLFGYDGPSNVAALFLTAVADGDPSCDDFELSVTARSDGEDVSGVGVTCSIALETDE